MPAENAPTESGHLQTSMIAPDHLKLVLTIHLNRGTVVGTGCEAFDTITDQRLGLLTLSHRANDAESISRGYLSNLIERVLDWAGPFPQF